MTEPLTITLAIISGITTILGFTSEILACSKCEANGICDFIHKTRMKRHKEQCEIKKKQLELKIKSQEAPF